MEASAARRPGIWQVQLAHAAAWHMSPEPSQPKREQHDAGRGFGPWPPSICEDVIEGRRVGSLRQIAPPVEAPNDDQQGTGD